MQVFWTKFKKLSYEAQVDECGMEKLYAGNGFEYTVTKPAVLHIVTQGRGTFIVDGSTYYLKEGDIFLLLKGMEVKYYSSGKIPWHYMWVGFSGSHALNYLNRSTLADDYVDQNHDTSDLFKLIFRICVLANSIITEESHDILLNQHLLELLYLLTQRYPKAIEVPEQLASQDLKVALEYFNNNFKSQRTTVDQAAKLANVSRSKLFKLFTKHFGVSPSKYLKELRMGYATHELTFTNKPIYEIASELDYAQSVPFTKAFTAHFNLSPSAYRAEKLNHKNS
ncbi:AraC family transcriptional regulator [Staphylococcus simulans]|uniref:AraC family transcriptional regulator n=1 Tax=Staphylococcus simulans TaxID=1286 RepID=UPI003F80AA37